jgi:peroxiredoxin
MKPLLTFLVLIAACQTGLSQDLAFDTPDIDGRATQLEKSSEPKLTVVCFLGTECPLAKLYATRLNEMSSEFSDVDFIGVCSNLQDSVDDLIEYRNKHEIVFPIIKDRKNLIADRYQAQRTPEVFLVDENLKVIYRGRIDDQYQPGLAKAATTRDDLKIAITEALSGQEISVASTEPFGCLIGRVKNESNPNSQITFANQVSRLLINHCAECHQDGEIGPMSLIDYDEVVGWADMIQEVVDDGRMPPWHADPKHGQFTNERRMTMDEKQMLRDWIADGAPMGDKSQLPKVEDPVVTKWRLPKQPDFVIAMRDQPFVVPAEGTVEYQYFVVDPGFKEDKWITAAEILPGERSVLHHSIVFVRPPDGAEFRGIGWLAAYVPGQGTPTYNPKYGRKIPAGSKLVFQQHYTPTGKEKSDSTQIGLIFGEESQIEHEVFTLVAVDQEFVIPPGASNHQVDAQFGWIPNQGKLLGVSPHMHYRGKSFRLTADFEDRAEILLNVPNYDFNWQHIYQLQDPLPLDSIKSLRFTAGFDNSANNPANPNPEETVTWGDQTWEEMAVAFAIVSEPRNARTLAKEMTPEEKQAEKERWDAVVKKANQFADDYFERFDKNENQKIESSELPRATRSFGSWSIDFNHDGKITKQDIIDSAIDRFDRFDRK